MTDISIGGLVTWLSDWFVSNTDSRLSDNRNFKTTRLSPTSSSPLDLDSFTTNGFYYVIGNSTYVPYVSNLPYDWGNNSFYLLVEDTDSATYKKQVITDYGARRVCVRSKWGAGWTDWKELLFGNWTEYKTVTNANNTFEYKVEYNQAFAKLTYWTTDTQSQSTSWSDYGTSLLSDTWIRPSQPVVAMDKTGDVLIRVNNDSAKLSHRSNTGASFSASGVYVEVLWAYRGYDTQYVDIEYLQSTGSQYINTGYILKSTDKVDVKFSSQGSIQYEAVFGARKSSYSQNAYVVFSRFGSSNKIVYNRSGNEKQGSTIQTNTIYEIHTEGQTCTVKQNGTVVQTITTTGTANDCINPCGLFTLNTDSSTGFTKDTYSNMKIYSFKITDANDNIIMNLKPVRDSGNVGYMYDTVTNRVLTNTGTFQIGNDL